MGKYGLIQIDRGILTHHLFGNDPLTRREAWLWMLCEATYTKDGRVKDVAGVSVKIKRGQFTHSIRFIAKSWKWSKSKTDRYIGRLKTETMIETDNGTGQLVITICNYETFQDVTKYRGTVNKTQNGTGAGQERDRSGTNLTPEVIPEVKKVIKDNTSSKNDVVVVNGYSFDVFWGLVPRKVGKVVAEKALQKAMKGGADFNEICAAMKKLECGCRFNGTQDKCVHPSTWLNEKRWLDDDLPHYAVSGKNKGSGWSQALNELSEKGLFDE